MISDTAKNNVISPSFLAWKFCGKAQFPHNCAFPQEIRWKYGIFCSEAFNKAKYSELVILLMTSAWMSETVTS